MSIESALLQCNVTIYNFPSFKNTIPSGSPERSIIRAPNSRKTTISLRKYDITNICDEIPLLDWRWTMNREKPSIHSIMVEAVSSGTMIIYLIIAVVLLALAFFSLYDIALGFWIMAAESVAAGMLHALHAVLLTIIVVEVLETVLVYLRTNIIQVRPILIAGITAMVRRLLFIDTEILTPLLLWELGLSILAILVLTFAIYIVSRDKAEI